jgi:hypothetical protein
VDRFLRRQGLTVQGTVHGVSVHRKRKRCNRATAVARAGRAEAFAGTAGNIQGKQRTGIQQFGQRGIIQNHRSFPCR